MADERMNQDITGARSGDLQTESPAPAGAAAAGDASRSAASAPIRRRGNRLLIALCAVLLAAGGAWGYLRVHGDIGLAPFLPPPNLVQVFGKRQLRVLVMGLDENWTQNDEPYTANARTDTLIGVNIDLASKEISVLSIPRDLWVYIPKSGYGKINEAYEDGGPERSELTVEKNLGAPPFDYYVVLRLDATKNVINALGGLDVDVEKNMDYDDNWGHLHIHLRKGLHHLTGEQVVAYIRFRHDPEGDFGRMRRQRQVVQILVKRLEDPSILLHLPQLLAVVRDNVRTNIPFGRLYDLALGLRGVTPRQVHSSVLPVDVGWVDGESVLFAASEAPRVVHRYLVAGFGTQFDPANVRVRVENGSGTPGAASAMADFLRQRGFDVVETANASAFNHATTTVRTANPKVAGEVAQSLPIKHPRIETRPVNGVDVVVIVGRDYQI